MEPNLDRNYTFSIDSAHNEIPFDAKSKRKSVITIKILFDLTRFEIELSVCNV